MKTTLIRDDSFSAISVEQAKQWCRIDTEDDDSLIEGLIATAQSAAENYTNRTIAPITCEFAFDEGDKRYTIPTAPVMSVSNVQLEYAEGVREALPCLDSYWVLLRDSGAVLTLAGNLRGNRTLIVTCEAGYASPDDVPAAIRQAIAVHVGSSYEGREGQEAATATFHALLNPFRVGGL